MSKRIRVALEDDPEFVARHEAAQTEHLLAEITRFEALRDRYPPTSVKYMRAQREIDLLHERVRRRRNAA